ncbi:MAG: hypothetical protein J0H96_11750 [Microbacterium ginsengisoli]|nr:hypothetical protein [Microbacterium ginsengisoli]
MTGLYQPGVDVSFAGMRRRIITVTQRGPYIFEAVIEGPVSVHGNLPFLRAIIPLAPVAGDA